MVGVLIVLLTNQWRAHRDASWKRVETALQLIAAGDDEKERIGWAIITRLIANGSISKKDADLIRALSTDLTGESADEDLEENAGIDAPSVTVDTNDDLPPEGSAP